MSQGYYNRMKYTELTKKAMMIAYEKHRGAFDKGGVPYIFHPYHLAEQMGDDEYAICVALLHDVVEDTNMTIDDLAREGFPEEIITAIKTLTHKDDVPYLGEYIRKIKKNPIARKVKLADLIHNSDVSRLTSKNEEISLRERLNKYKSAIEILSKGDDDG